MRGQNAARAGAVFFGPMSPWRGGRHSRFLGPMVPPPEKKIGARLGEGADSLRSLYFLTRQRFAHQVEAGPYFNLGLGPGRHGRQVRAAVAFFPSIMPLGWCVLIDGLAVIGLSLRFSPGRSINVGGVSIPQDDAYENPFPYFSELLHA